MAPFIGRSGVLMNLAPLTSAGLVKNGTLVEVPEDVTEEEIADLLKEKFGVGADKSATEETPETPKAKTEVEKPRGNASRDDWVAYAVSQGTSEDDLAGLKQGEIRALFEQDSDEAAENAKADAEAKAKADAEAAEAAKQNPSGSDNE
ncbi:hypothetical protein [Glutamicibacter ardleyensis]|uniref:hypothetical protein n=1 Tax=Glutamicibacter ardleyensis TaxID=225894 RepID=UPI003FCF520F